jgi:hypothetical protein
VGAYLENTSDQVPSFLILVNFESDFWIIVFSMLFTVPVLIVLVLLFERKKLEIYNNPD